MYIQRVSALLLSSLLVAVAINCKRVARSQNESRDQSQVCPVQYAPLADDSFRRQIQSDRTFDSRIIAIFSNNTLQQSHATDTTSVSGSARNIINDNNNGAATSTDLNIDIRLAKPAIELAINDARVKYPNVRLNVTYRAGTDICKHQRAAGHAADEYYRGINSGAAYFVGPSCSEPLESVGRLASYWNVPICSTGYLPTVLTASFEPPTLLQLSLSVQSIGSFF